MVDIATLGRASLATTLTALAADGPPAVPAEVLVVDDRPAHPAPLVLAAVPFRHRGRHGRPGYHWLRGGWSHRGVPAARARARALNPPLFTSRW